jgi:hypothetical protein
MIAPIGPNPAVNTEICARDHELRKLGRLRARVTDDAVSGEQRAKSSAGVVLSAAAIFARDAIEGDT